MAKTVNVYKTYFYYTYISYFEQEGWQKRRMITKLISYYPNSGRMVMWSLSQARDDGVRGVR